MRKGPQFQAIPRADGTFDLALVATNGAQLWRDNQGRPFTNLKRDLGVIKKAFDSARVKPLKVMDYPADYVPGGSAEISPDTDPLLPNG